MHKLQNHGSTAGGIKWKESVISIDNLSDLTQAKQVPFFFGCTLRHFENTKTFLITKIEVYKNCFHTSEISAWTNLLWPVGSYWFLLGNVRIFSDRKYCNLAG